MKLSVGKRRQEQSEIGNPTLSASISLGYVSKHSPFSLSSRALFYGLYVIFYVIGTRGRFFFFQNRGNFPIHIKLVKVLFGGRKILMPKKFFYLKSCCFL